jgi:hypothetical protein
MLQRVFGIYADRAWTQGLTSTMDQANILIGSFIRQHFKKLTPFQATSQLSIYNQISWLYDPPLVMTC